MLQLVRPVRNYNFSAFVQIATKSYSNVHVQAYNIANRNLKLF